MDRNKERSRTIMDIISGLTGSGVSNEIISIAKADLEYGIDGEMVEQYAKSGRSVEFIRKYSEVLKETKEPAFVRFIWDGEFSVSQMDILSEFYRKGIPLEKLEELMGKEREPQELRNALMRVYEEMQAVDRLPDENVAEMEKLREQIRILAKDIGKNHTFYEMVSEQLKRLNEREDDSRKERFAQELDRKDRMLEEQQTSLNRAVSENASLRVRITELEEKVKNMERAEERAERFKAEAEEWKKERDEMAQNMDSLKEEKDSLYRELEQMKAQTGEKSETKREIPVEYQAVLDGKNSDITVTLERTQGKKQESLFALFGKKFFPNRRHMRIIKTVAEAGLDKAQMKQVTNAIQAGLTEYEIVDIINSGFDAEEMEQAVEIVLAERRYQ